MIFSLEGSVLFHGRKYERDELRRMETLVLDRMGDPEPGRPVALAMNRTPFMLAMLFALLKKGVPFLPLDLSFPEERLRYMLEKAEIKTILSDCVKSVCGKETVFFEQSDEAWRFADALTNDERDVINDGEVAYVLFTSGTTGLPKAVEVLRRGLKNFIEGIAEIIDFGDNPKMACLTNVTFDIFFLESVLALNRGMTVVLADEEERKNPRLIKKLIESNGVTAVQCTPSTMRMLEMIDPEYAFLRGVNTLMIGGEPFPPTMLKALQGIPALRTYNMYGPTETTIWSTVSELTKSEGVNIGKPIKATRILIAGDDLKVLPDGEEGEILIAGDGLAKGYLKDEERTSKAFTSVSVNGEKLRVYRTGDFGYLGADGNYVCIGRRDGQVKVLGHRIELGDIEHHVGRISGVGNNVVAADPENDNRLLCFYLSDQDLEDAYLRREALKLLPDYMVPSDWIRVGELLYTASGKTDRKAMLGAWRVKVKERTAEKQGALQRAEAAKSDDQIVARIISCFEGTVEDLTEDTVLEALGLDSLQYVSCLVKIEEEFDMEFMDDMLSADYFHAIRDMADYIKTLVDA